MSASEENTVSGFIRTKRGATTYYLRTDLNEKFISAPESLFSAPVVGKVRGRKEHKLISAAGEKFVLRHYQHGGILRFFTRDLYLTASRFLQELAVSSYALSQAIPTPEIAALRIKRTLLGYKADILSRHIADSADLQKLLREDSREIARARKREIIDNCAKLIRRMHDAGILHADLHAKNILLSFSGSLIQLYILDLDRAKILKSLSLRQRLKNLFRLGRSLDKISDAGIITERDKYRFFLKYLKADEALPINKRAVVAQFARHRKIHSIWRRITRGSISRQRTNIDG